jgi:anti-sigma B factor antagonist
MADATARFTRIPNLFPAIVGRPTRVGMSRPSLTMDVTVGDDRATVKLRGEIDLATAREVEERAGQLLRRPIGHLTLDLREVRTVDSVGLAALLRVGRRADAATCAFVLLNPSPLVRRALHVTGLSRVLTVEITRD